MSDQNKTTTAPEQATARPAGDGKAKDIKSTTVPQLDDLLNSLLGTEGTGDTAPPEPAAEETGEESEAPAEETGQAPEAEPAAPAEGETETEGEQAEEDVSEETQPRKWPSSAQRRVDTLTKQLHTIQADLEHERKRVRAFEERSEQTGAQPQRPSRGTGLENFNAEQLDTLEQNTETVLADLEDYLDNVATESQSAKIQAYANQRGLDEPGLKRHRRDLQRLLERAIPARLKEIEQEASKKLVYSKLEAEAEPQVLQHFPWFKDRASEEYQTASQVLQTLPEIKKLPHWKLASGIFVLGLQKFRELQAAKAKLTPSALPPNQPTRATSSPARPTRPEVRRQQLKTTALKGDEAAVAGYFEHELSTGAL